MEVHEAIRSWKPCRAFQLRPIQEEVLKKVLNAARFAPSAGDQQPWRFVVIRDEEDKKRVANVVTKGHFLTMAPVVLVALGVEEAASAVLGGYMLAYSLDVAAAIENLVLAAHAEGLGSCWCTEFKEDRLREILKIPEGVRVIGVVPLGYPDPTAAGNGGPAQRKSLSEIVAYDGFTW
jgi:nitroreductase